MSKNKKTKTTKEKRKAFIERKDRSDGSSEYVITKSPMKTWWGKTLIIILAIGMIGGAVAGLIIALINL